MKTGLLHPNLLSLRLEGEESVGIVSVDPYEQSFNIISNNPWTHAKVLFFILDWKYAFWEIWSKKSKLSV